MAYHSDFLFTIKILAMFVKHPNLIMLQDSLTPVTMTFFYGSTIILFIPLQKGSAFTNIHGEHGKNVG